MNHLLLQMRIVLAENANARLITFRSPFLVLTPGMFQPKRYQTIVDVCRIEITDRKDRRHERQWPVIHSNARKNKKEKIGRFRIVRQWWNETFYFYFSCIFFCNSHFTSLSFIQKDLSKFVFNIYLRYSYMLYIAVLISLNVKPFLYRSRKKDSIIGSSIKETWLFQKV